MSEPKGRGGDWTEERGTSDEGRSRPVSAPEASGRQSMGKLDSLVPRMRDICGPGNVITDPLELRTYECDGLTAHRCVPALVVLPGSAAEVALVVAACARAGVPFVAPGGGPGRAAGARPAPGGGLGLEAPVPSVPLVAPGARWAGVRAQRT